MIDIFWNAANRLYKKKPFIILARFFELLSFIISSHSVSAQIEVGEGTCFYHHALGCTILQTVKVGDNCKIFPNVTIGYAFSNSKKYYGGGPVIGNNCVIGSGAKILGNVCIGNNVNIGANAVVLENIPDNCTVVGIPGKIIKRGEIKE